MVQDTLPYLLSGQSYKSKFIYHRILSYCIIGSCVTAGFNGCCSYANNTSCRGHTPSGSLATCYCDLYCYTYGDCCTDVNATGCYSNSSGKNMCFGYCLLLLSPPPLSPSPSPPLPLSPSLPLPLSPSPSPSPPPPLSPSLSLSPLL